MKRANVFRWLSLLILAAPLIACEKASSSSAVTPDLAAYSPAVQELAAYELSKLAPPCPRDTVIATCSAVHRLVIDYGDMRNQVRAIRN